MYWKTADLASSRTLSVHSELHGYEVSDGTTWSQYGGHGRLLGDVVTYSIKRLTIDFVFTGDLRLVSLSV